MIRVCPKRDAKYPHGMSCPYTIDRYSYRDERQSDTVGLPSDCAGLVDALWQEILDKDDRTSPAEYPDMALITFDEFREAIAALSRATEADGWQHISTCPIAFWTGEGGYVERWRWIVPASPGIASQAEEGSGKC